MCRLDTPVGCGRIECAPSLCPTLGGPAPRRRPATPHSAAQAQHCGLAVSGERRGPSSQREVGGDRRQEGVSPNAQAARKHGRTRALGWRASRRERGRSSLATRQGGREPRGPRGRECHSQGDGVVGGGSAPTKPKQRTKTRTPHGMRGRGGERGVAQREGTQVARQHESRRSRGGAAGEGERRRVPQRREGVVGGGAWPKAAVAAQRRERDVCGAAARARPTPPSSSPPHGSRPTECLREERRSSQRAGEGRVGSAHAHRSRGTASRQHTPAHSREGFVAPGEDARPSPSWMDL